MTEKQVLLVKHSWSYQTGQLETLGTLFTKKLIALNPELKVTLKRTVGELRTHSLMLALNQIVAALPNLRKAHQNIQQIVTEYAALGMTRADYENALIAFLLALEKRLGKNWNGEMREAWIFIFSSLYHQVSRPRVAAHALDSELYLNT
jgi:hemoglobin-like flavoprotein